MLRIGFHDLDDFAEVREKLSQTLMIALHREMARWLRRPCKVAERTPLGGVPRDRLDP